LGIIFCALGAFFSEKYRPMIWAQIVPKHRPKFTSTSSRFLLLFAFQISNFD
jgi:hypothetical protein